MHTRDVQQRDARRDVAVHRRVVERCAEGLRALCAHDARDQPRAGRAHRGLHVAHVRRRHARVRVGDQQQVVARRLALDRRAQVRDGRDCGWCGSRVSIRTYRAHRRRALLGGGELDDGPMMRAHRYPSSAWRISGESARSPRGRASAPAPLRVCSSGEAQRPRDRSYTAPATSVVDARSGSAR